jgi:hypothetical protein
VPGVECVWLLVNTNRACMKLRLKVDEHDARDEPHALLLLATCVAGTITFVLDGLQENCMSGHCQQRATFLGTNESHRSVQSGFGRQQSAMLGCNHVVDSLFTYGLSYGGGPRQRITPLFTSGGGWAIYARIEPVDRHLLAFGDVRFRPRWVGCPKRAWRAAWCCSLRGHGR